VYAQDRGVCVAVLGIGVNGDRNQSAELVREADQSLVLPQTILDNTLTRRVLSTQPVNHPAVIPSTPQHPSITAVDSTFSAFAEQFARDWMSKTTPEERAALLANRPRIPKELDSQMLQYTVRASGVYTIGDEPRRAMRAAFWRIANSAVI